MMEQSFKRYQVWDPLLRGLHWWNAATISMQLFTGALLVFVCDDHHEGGYGPTLIIIHSIVGYLVGAGLLTRIIWLFSGPESARLGDLLPLASSQRKVFVDTLRFYTRLLRGTPPLYKAHNSFAGVIYLLFFVVASMQVVSGAMSLKLSEEVRKDSFAFELHELGFMLIIAFILAHVFAVFVHELVERHGLISAMVNGRKTFTEEEWKRLED